MLGTSHFSDYVQAVFQTGCGLCGGAGGALAGAVGGDSVAALRQQGREVQAGAMGLPSIVTDINGCNEIIVDGKNGRIIKPQDINSLRGLRPGEKLYEEVLSDEEHTLPTGHSQIRIAKVREYDHDEAAAHVRDLERLAADGNIPELIRLMKAIVPEFKSNNSPFEQFDQQQSTNSQSTN